jgi:Leucine-rich repeat (LRR) protein
MFTRLTRLVTTTGVRHHGVARLNAQRVAQQRDANLQSRHFAQPSFSSSAGTLAEDEERSYQPACSLAEASRMKENVTVLDLTHSSDLTCMNLMCEKVGEPCICRLSLALERTPNVQELSLARNKLEQLPDSVWNLKELRSLDLSDNALRTLSPLIAQLTQLRHLNLSGNPGIELPSKLPEGLEDIKWG